MDPKTLRLKIAAAPEAVKSWLGSDQVVGHIKTINEHFSITDKNQNIIPRLLLRLEIQDLEPLYFAGELAHELQIDSDKARVISSEIRRLVLSPIKNELDRYGVNISLLDNFEMPLVRPRVAESAPVVEEVKKPSLPSFRGASPAEIPVVFEEVKKSRETVAPKSPPPVTFGTQPFSRPAPEKPATPAPFGMPQKVASETPKPKEAAPTPFMLHEEPVLKPAELKPEFRFDLRQKIIGEEKPSGARSAFEELGLKKPERGGAWPAQVELGQAKVEKPPTTGKTDVPPPRVVHYSQWKPPETPSASLTQPPAPTSPKPPAPPSSVKTTPVLHSSATAEGGEGAPLPPKITVPESSRPVQAPPPPAPPVKPIVPPPPPPPPPATPPKTPPPATSRIEPPFGVSRIEPPPKPFPRVSAPEPLKAAAPLPPKPNAEKNLPRT